MRILVNSAVTVGALILIVVMFLGAFALVDHGGLLGVAGATVLIVCAVGLAAAWASSMGE